MITLLTLEGEGKDYIEQKLELAFPANTIYINSYTSTLQLAGVAALTPVVHGDCSLHLAGLRKRFFTPDFATDMFRVAFVLNKATRITATIAETDDKCRKLAEHVGFSLEAILEGYTFGKLALYRMLRSECKWGIS